MHSRLRKLTGIIALSSALFLTPTLAMAQDDDAAAKSIAARQGFMKVVLWDAGPLFGMAKGEVAYDAAKAQANAANLKALTDYAYSGLFLEGSSKDDRPGKTRALAKIWSDMGGFEKAYDDFRTAVAALADQAGNGQAALAAAVGEMGKSCGGCHKPYRAKEF